MIAEASSSWIVTVLEVLALGASLLLIMLVLIQREKGGGLSGAFGGSGSMATFGVKTADVLEKATWFFFILFVLFTFSMAIIARQDTLSSENVTKKSTSESEVTDGSKEPLPAPDDMEEIVPEPSDDGGTPPEPDGNN